MVLPTANAILDQGLIALAGLGDACGPTKGQAEAVPWFDDVCGGQPSVYALSGSCSGRGVAEANVERELNSIW